MNTAVSPFKTIFEFLRPPRAIQKQQAIASDAQQARSCERVCVLLAAPVDLACCHFLSFKMKAASGLRLRRGTRIRELPEEHEVLRRWCEALGQEYAWPAWRTRFF